MSSETWLWIVVAVLVVRSVMQQIYIRRLKNAMLNIVEALQRDNRLRLGDVLRGGSKVEL